MICAIILAAGYSRRMGTQKLLLPLAGKPVIAHVVDEALRAPVEQVFVVTGAASECIVAALSDRGVTFVANPHPEFGMLGSVRCGLAALPSTCQAVLVMLGDQPAIKAEVIARLVQNFRTAGPGIIVPVCDGRRGHPLLVAMRYRDELCTHYDRVGLRGLLQAHPGDICEVAVTNRGILLDLDVPEDYERWILCP